MVLTCKNVELILVVHSYYAYIIYVYPCINVNLFF